MANIRLCRRTRSPVSCYPAFRAHALSLEFSEHGLVLQVVSDLYPASLGWTFEPTLVVYDDKNSRSIADSVL